MHPSEEKVKAKGSGVLFRCVAGVDAEWRRAAHTLPSFEESKNELLDVGTRLEEICHYKSSRAIRDDLEEAVIID